MIGNHIMLVASRVYVWWRHPDSHDVVQEEPPSALCMRASWFPRVLVPALLVGCFSLIIIMLQRPAFTFAFEGAVMLLQEGVHTPANRTYSMIQIVKDIPKLAPDTVGGYVLASSFCFFGVIMPLVHILVAFVTWIVPLDLHAQKRVCIVGDIIGAWSGLDLITLTM